MIQMTSTAVTLMAALACLPTLTADAQEPSLKAGDYTLEMNIKAMGDRGKQSKPAKVTVETGKITVKVEGIGSDMQGGCWNGREIAAWSHDDRKKQNRLGPLHRRHFRGPCKWQSVLF